MKFNKEESSVNGSKNKDEIEFANADCSSKYFCPTCTTLMIPLIDNAVQCDLLTEKNALLGIASDIKNGSRRGSVQSMTEVQEEVPYVEEVATVDTLTAPNEILLVTRSFENEASTKPPRRSSIAQFIDGIKSLGNRRKSEPPMRFNLDVDAQEQDAISSGLSGGSDGLKSSTSGRIDLDRNINGDNGEIQGKALQRKSFQLDNGTMVEEEIEEYDAKMEIKTEGPLSPGEINFVSRSFETVLESDAPRRESIIDKLNFLKMLGKFRTGSDPQNVEDTAKGQSKIAAASGVRRKSLAPALLQNGLLEEDEDDIKDYSEWNGGLSTVEEPNEDHQGPFCTSPVRYVTSGIRRGSVAAVSAAPPFIGAVSEERKTSELIPSTDDICPNVRYVTDGLRRGSVAGVSAAPPCVCPNSQAVEPGLSTSDLQIDGQDGLRSGIRRRSLTPAYDDSEDRSPASSPVAAKRVVFGLSTTDIGLGDDSSDEEEDAERERKSSDVADEFMNRVKKRYETKGKRKEGERKGAVNLFEELTGRKIGVDYSTIDARQIQEKLDEEYDMKQKAFDQSSIPTITLSIDELETDQNDMVVDEQNNTLSIDEQETDQNDMVVDEQNNTLSIDEQETDQNDMIADDQNKEENDSQTKSEHIKSENDDAIETGTELFSTKNTAIKESENSSNGELLDEKEMSGQKEDN